MQCAVSAQVLQQRGGVVSEGVVMRVVSPGSNFKHQDRLQIVSFVFCHDVLYFVIWWSGEELRREAISVAVEGFGAEGIAELEEKS